MRIFLSFASEQKDVAEAILLALRGRGHSVFFSKDDLPVGEGYDARIQEAIRASDLMLFLISPESVRSGRYTLTELSFARKRWPNPSGRVLPVLVATTPLDTIPAYLKAVTILEPAGNIAAETSAEVDKLSTKSHHLAIIAFGLFGFVTALCSYLSISLFPDLKIGVTPILPGLLFGSLVAACAYKFAVRERFLLFVIILLTTCGWVVAHKSAISAAVYLAMFNRQDYTFQERGIPPPPAKPTEFQIPVAGFGGAVGGFIGGFFTLFGLAIACPLFRRFDRWVVPLAIATVMGCVVMLTFRNFWLSREFLLIVFVIWQPAVSASIAREFARTAANLAG